MQTTLRLSPTARARAKVALQSFDSHEALDCLVKSRRTFLSVDGELAADFRADLIHVISKFGMARVEADAFPILFPSTRWTKLPVHSPATLPSRN